MPHDRLANTVSDTVGSSNFRAFPKTWGSECISQHNVRFRLWAPEIQHLSLRIDGADREMPSTGDGWFELVENDIAPDTRYAFVLSDGTVVPDPAARAQDGGIGGASIVTEPTAYHWQNPHWQSPAWSEATIYELHIGTFTPGGTFRSAIEKLQYLAGLGITAIEIMPVNQFPGERGWGYDGVLLYAPHHAYGTPDDFKALIDAAHGLGIMVILDVVYNHFGPQGNYLHAYAKSFFDPEKHTPWGAAIDFREKPVRDFFVENALYWLVEFNLDGLRLDAVHAIDDASELHFISELASRVHSECTDRRRHLIVEDERNTTRFLQRDNGQATEIDAGWNDDFHHIIHVMATGEDTGFLKEFAEDTFHKLGLALAEGYTRTIDEPIPISDTETASAASLLPSTAFVIFLQNHDQIGNRPIGDRLTTLAKPDLIETLQTILLLSPAVPMLFMGEEYGETRPFYFFCAYDGEIGNAVRSGRLKDAKAIGFVAEDAGPDQLPDPNDPQTFTASKLDWNQVETEAGNAKLARLRDLLALRRMHVQPGLHGEAHRAGSLLSYEEGIIAIDWQLNGFVWEMRANLSDAPATVCPLTGEIVHAHPAGASISNEMIGPLAVIFARRAD